MEEERCCISKRHQRRIYCRILIIVGLEIQSCINSIKVSFACLQEKQRNFSKYIIVKWYVNWKTRSWSDEQIGILDVRGQVTRSELDYAS